MTLRIGAILGCMLLAASGLHATILDLTTAGASDTKTAALGGAFTVVQVSPQSTGTGVIDSFLRIGQTGQERGYNTSANNPPLDDKAGNFTRALTLAEIPVVTIGTTEYRQFLLDINQTKQNCDVTNNDGQLDNSCLSLNQIQIFQAGGDPGTSYTALNEATPTTDALISFDASVATEVFRLNNVNMTDAARLEIQLNFSLNPGSGGGDMFLYVPNSDFDTSLSNVILFSQFGNPRGTYSSNDGFEEWAVLSPVPEPAPIILLGTILFGVAHLFRRRRSA